MISQVDFTFEKRFSSRFWTAIVPLFVVATSILWLNYVDAGQAIIVGAAVAGQAALGLIFLDRVMQSREFTFSWAAGPSFALGSFFSVVVWQVIVELNSALATVCAISILIAAVLMSTRRSDPGSNSFKSSVNVGGHLLLGTLLFLGISSGWHLVVLVMTLIVIGLAKFVIRGNEKIRRLTWIVAGVAAVSLRLVVDKQDLSVLQWHSDHTFSQTLANTLGNWGLFDHAAASGNAVVYGYHWLVYSWIGMVESISRPDTFDTLQFAVPAVFGFTTLAAVRAFGEALKSQTAVSPSMLSLFAVISSLMFLRLSGSISLLVVNLWLVTLVCLVLRLRDFAHSWWMSVVVVSLFAATWLGKLSTGAVVIVGMVGAALILSRKREASAQLVIPVVGSILFVALERLGSLLGSGDALGSGMIKLDWISESAFGWPGSRAGVIAIVGAVVVTANVFFNAFALWVENRASQQINLHTRVLLVAVLLVAALVPFVLNGHALVIYYYVRNPGLVVGALCLMVFMPKMFSLLRELVSKNPVQAALLVLLSVSTWGLWQLANEFAERISGIDTKLLSDAYWVPALFAFLIVALAFRFEARRSLGVLLVLSLGFGSFLPLAKIIDEAWTERVMPLVQDQLLRSEKTLVPAELADLTMWISENTTKNDLFASNVFCPWANDTLADRCQDPDWWTMDRESLDVNGAFDNACVGDGARQEYFINFWLPAVTKRRYIIQGPDYLVGCRKNPEWIAQAIEASENFGRSGDPSACLNLVGNGAKYFVQDSRISTTQFEGPKPVFTSSSFAVYELSASGC